MIRRMIREEWRMHSTLYRGKSFAMFPLVVFGFSLLFSYLTLRYSTVSSDSLGLALQAMGGFIGLAVGSLGFSSRDAVRNVLGPMNLLVYSSRTLPVSERRLLLDFIVKDIIYYIALFLLPVALGPLLLGGSAMFEAVFMMVLWFLAALFLALVAARSSIRLPSSGFLKYSRISPLGALSAKSLLDISRSSGGVIKVLFSLGVLTGFYWFAVLYFPATRKLLTNPLLSFSVMIGTLNLSLYNWLNRFDSLEKYIYLPVKRDDLLDAKKKAYLSAAVPLTLIVVLVSYFFYPQNLLVSIVSGITSTLFTLFVAVELTGLDPNQRLFSSIVLLKFILANSVVIVPLLLFSIIYTPSYLMHYLAACIAVSAFSVLMLRYR